MQNPPISLQTGLKTYSWNHGLIPICSGVVDNHRLYLTKEHDDICLDLSDFTYQLIDAFMKYRDLTLHEPPVAKCPGHDKKERMPCKNPKLYKKPPLRFLLWLKDPEQYPAG